MASTTEGSTQLLDQLQGEVNKVFEQMGRFFAAVNENPKVVPAVQANNLKQVVPGAIDNFHNALDQLEHELQLAKLVMRRDLAVSRERAGLVKPALVNGTVSPADITISEETIKPNESQSKPTEDAVMEDVQPGGEADVTAALAEDKATEEKPDDAAKDDEKPEEQAKLNTADESSEKKASDPNLQIDTQTQPKNTDDQAEGDNPPDTGTLTNDFESLFGGPTSADAGDGEGSDFNDNFDFGFGTDNNADNDEDITSLLPGLQDYANTTSDANAADFDFNFDDVAMGNGNNDETQQLDSDFNSFLDLEDFTNGNFGGSGADSNNANASTEFDFSQFE